ncbi:MAG: hypothetical protein ORN54_10035 [Cyclobacteriaceae bacterium]|nr:hypothetical protein [Cyclobacteriaceae bacterium]
MKEIIDYYNEISFRAMLSKNGNWKEKIAFPACFLIVAGLFFCYIKTDKWYFLIGAIVFFWLTYYVAIYLNAKIVRRYNPDIYVSRFDWSETKFRKTTKTKLKDKLIGVDLAKKKQVKQVSASIKQKAIEERKQYRIYGVLTGALLAPVGYHFIGMMFSVPEKLIPFFNFGLVIFIIFFIMIMGFFIDFRDRILTRYNTLNELSEYLDDIVLDY